MRASSIPYIIYPRFPVKRGFDPERGNIQKSNNLGALDRTVGLYFEIALGAQFPWRGG